MYRNHYPNRPRNGGARNENFRSGENRDRHNWRDNRQINDDDGREMSSGKDYMSETDPGISNFCRNMGSQEFQRCDNSGKSDDKGLHDSFSTPVNRFLFSEEGINHNSPIQQQFKNLLGPNNVDIPVSYTNQGFFQSPNTIPIGDHNQNSVINQNHNYSPFSLSGGIKNNANSIHSVNPMSRLPTFSPVSCSHTHSVNPFPEYNISTISNNTLTQNSSYARFSNNGGVAFGAGSSPPVTTSSNVYGPPYQSNKNIFGSNPIHMAPSNQCVNDRINMPQQHSYNAYHSGIIDLAARNEQISAPYGNFTERDKAMLQSLLHLDKELLDLYEDIRKVNKKDYPLFPRCDKNGMVPPDEYRAWRRTFLVQLQRKLSADSYPHGISLTRIQVLAINMSE